MDDPSAAIRELAEIQERLIELPSDAFEERYRLRTRQDELRAVLRADPGALDASRSNEDLMSELTALRQQMRAIEKQRIDLVGQAGSGGPGSGEMGNLGGVKINKGIDQAQGLDRVKARIGIIKGVLIDRGVTVPEAD